ncbi:MAG: dTMP kinase [Thermoplasmata archaeon]|nr:dTMP kinase [Thermoplasmata archaeon]
MTIRKVPKGRLIILEGIDGAGKSSVQRALIRRWRSRGLRVVARREPADPVLARQAVAAGPRDPALAALYFTLDRILARPAVDRLLQDGTTVLQDRSFYSTLVYQGSRLPARQGRELNDLQRIIAPPPDAVVLLELGATAALARVVRGRRHRSPIERLALLRAAAKEYRSLARRERWIVVDASLPLPGVVEEVDRRLRPSMRAAPRASQRSPSRPSQRGRRN